MGTMDGRPQEQSQVVVVKRMGRVRIMAFIRRVGTLRGVGRFRGQGNGLEVGICFRRIFLISLRFNCESRNRRNYEKPMKKSHSDTFLMRMLRARTL